MHTRLDGAVAEPSAENLYWADRPEFGFLFDHRLSSEPPPVSPSRRAAEMAAVSLKQALANADTTASAETTLLAAFRHKLGRVLGCAPDGIDAGQPASSLGLDSLSAVECRQWFYNGALPPPFQMC